MADVSGTLRAWSTTASNNAPGGSTSIGTGLDDNLREIQKVIRQYLASQGSNMVSAATVDLATADGFYVHITGTTAITAFGTEPAGIQYLLEFDGILTLTYNATSLILPGAANITTAAGDMALVISLGSGNWKCAYYQRASGTPIFDTFNSFRVTRNASLAFSAAASALTCSLKTQDGGDPTVADPVIATFPHATITNGTFNIRTITAAISMVISSGSTLGHGNNVAGSIYHYLIDNSGTVEYAVGNKFFGDHGIVTTTAEGGAGAADSGSTMYSTTARASVPFICIGRSKDTQTTAGTWSATPSEIQLWPFLYKTPTRQVITATGTYTKPWDLLSADVEVQAGGGGGGGADVSAGGNFSAASGGGGGGYARKILDAGTIGATETATVGAGGTAGTNSGGTGGTGGTTSFGSHVSATGGVGGGGALDTSVTLGGAGGVGSGGDFNLEGADGANGYSFADAGNKIGGNGGSSHLGGGGRGAGAIGDTDSAGASGNVYGGGGGGAVSDTTTGAAGGTGGAGIIIVTEYYG